MKKDNIINNVEGFKAKKISDYGITPCDIIFNHVTKPDDFLCCKSINVFDDRWRVNIYSKRCVEGIEGKRISQSYFINFNNANGNMTFVSPKI
jgi:hypothetical protein